MKQPDMLSATATYPTLNGPFTRPGQVDARQVTLWTIDTRPIGDAWVVFARRSGERAGRSSLLGVTTSWDLARRALNGDRLDAQMSCWNRPSSYLLRDPSTGTEGDVTMMMWDGSLESLYVAVGTALLAEDQDGSALIPVRGREGMAVVRPGDVVVVDAHYLSVIPHDLIMS